MAPVRSWIDTPARLAAIEHRRTHRRTIWPSALGDGHVPRRRHERCILRIGHFVHVNVERRHIANAADAFLWLKPIVTTIKPSRSDRNVRIRRQRGALRDGGGRLLRLPTGRQQRAATAQIRTFSLDTVAPCQDVLKKPGRRTCKLPRRSSLSGPRRVLEWLNRPVSKTGVRASVSRGSDPSLSAGHLPVMKTTCFPRNRVSVCSVRRSCGLRRRWRRGGQVARPL